jgi:hypothetical protein
MEKHINSFTYRHPMVHLPIYAVSISVTWDQVRALIFVELVLRYPHLFADFYRLHDDDTFQLAIPRMLLYKII